MAVNPIPQAITILERRRVAPPQFSSAGGGTEQLSLPLVFFDMVWLHFSPIQRLLFYHFPCTQKHFLQTIVPNLTKSLSQTLEHFLPLAGNLIYPLNSASTPEFWYVPGDSVSVTIAESTEDSDHYFNYLTGDKARIADDYHALVPDLPEPEMDVGSGCKIIPVFAVQVTLFRDIGICLGFANHHAIGDASSIVGFIKLWSLVAMHDGDVDQFLAEKHLLPIYDRSVIKDPSRLAHTFWRQMDVFKIESTPLKFPTNKVRSTYILTENHIRLLKSLVLAKRPSSTASSFTVTTAYIWTCLVKSATESGEIVDDREPEYFVFAVDARRRVEPPVPAPYFGNCVAFGTVESTHGRMRGEEGFLIAVDMIGDEICNMVNNKDEILRDADKWMSRFGDLIGRRTFGVAGSPRFDLYGVDFGWGKPVKFENVSIDGAGSMSLCKSREFQGGLEIGLSLPEKKMDAFSDIFFRGLKI